MTGTELDFERCYRAVDSRDARFDGWFFTAVTSTGIYCRPSCPAATPKRSNVRFFPSAAAAQRGGFRACRRCRPDAAPGSPQWDSRADVVGRAVRLIADGVVDRYGVPGLAARVGYTTRHLHRMLVAELGAGPLALARAQRAQTARTLVERTELGLAEIAFAAGFGSVRQFNDTLREVFAVSPSQLRAAAKRDSGARPGTLALRLPYRPPLHWPALLGFLAGRAIPGVELVDHDSYRRALWLPHGTGEVTLSPADGYLLATLRLADLRDLAPAVARCRRLLDLDADPVAVDDTLAADPVLAATVRAEPGVRLPRTVDGFELAVRAVVGQQVSVPAARRVLGRLVDALHPACDGTADRPAVAAQPAPDGPAATAGRAVDAARLRPFPGAAAVAGAPDAAFAMPAARRRTLRLLADAVGSGTLRLDGGADRAETERALLALPGIGPWTARYLIMRGLGDPDVFLGSDLGVRRAAARAGLPDDPTELDRYAHRYRPWRSYATIRFWRL